MKKRLRCFPIDEDISQFCGINSLRLKILNIFWGNVEIRGVRTKIKFYTVPDDTMAYKVLLERDFLVCPSLSITLDENIEIEAAEKTNANAEQILNVEVIESCRIHGELQVNPARGRDNVDKINEIYESWYVQRLREEKCKLDFEMRITLKHDLSSRSRKLSFTDKEALQKILNY